MTKSNELNEIKRVPFSSSMNGALKRNFIKYCKVNDLQINDVLELIVQKYLEEKEGKGDGNNN